MRDFKFPTAQGGRGINIILPNGQQHPQYEALHYAVTKEVTSMLGVGVGLATRPLKTSLQQKRWIMKL